MDVKVASDYYPVEEDGKQLKRLSNTTGGPVGSGDAVANANTNRLRGWPHYPVVEDVKGASDYYPVVEEDGKQLKRLSNTTGGPVGSGDAVANVNTNRLRGWHHSSRIIRVSRASGGKDRHSKVWTSKGLRDRRVRLSVGTAIQFYDLQDRLGYDQPSKAVDWLIRAAADPISELPSLRSPFPDTPNQLRDEKHASEQIFDSADVELDNDPNFQQNKSQHLSRSKSSWNSASGDSESSGLSLSRSEIRVKARERARERAAKEKEKENCISNNSLEIPQSSSLLSLPPEYKKSLEAEPAKEMDLMELTADDGMDRESQACMEQELGNAAYTKNDFDAAIAHYTKVMELDNGNISCLMNRAVAYLAMGQYDECIKDCDKAVERGRQLKSDSKMIAISLTRKGIALVKMAKLSKDYDTAIETFQKALLEHRIPCTLKKLNDAKKAKRELEQREYFDTKLADEEHEEDPDVEVVAVSPKTLLAMNEFVCEICKKGFKREQNLQLHRRGHNLSGKPSQRSSKDVKKKVYMCPEPSCVHHDPSRALGDLMGIKKHFCRKHSEKKWKCNKCSKKYAVWSDWRAHSKICGTREYKCDCGTLFSRKDSFIKHRVFCDALAEGSARAQTQPVVNPNSKLETKIQAVDDQGRSYSPSWLFKNLHNTPLNPNPGLVSTVDSSPPTPALARAQARLAPPQSTGVISLVLPIKSPEETSENEIASEHHGMEIDIEEVKMNDSSEQKEFEIEEIGNEASQTRQPAVIQVEDMQLQASSTLKPQRVLFDVNAVNILKSSGLMQSQIEDVEMKSEASGCFLMQGGLGLIMPPKDDDWKNAKEIYLMDNELSILPENPRCPNLSALFLPRNYKLRTIPPSFFDHMPALQILNLSRTSIKSLPDSIIKLVSLKRLFLNNCHRLMTLSPKVGDHKQLEVIDLEGAKIMDLPMEIKELTNLKCLEVSFYGYISNGNGKKAMQSNAVVPCGVISALSLLEELNIDVNPDDERWDACAEDIVTEVCTLKRLETLKFYFPMVELLRHFQWNSLKLSHFRFTVGHHAKRIMSQVPCDVEFELERWEKCLKYINGVGVPGDIKKVLQHAVAFFLDRHATVKKLSDFGLRNMKQLKCCVMGECNEVQVIVDEADADEEDDTSKIVSDSYGTERIVLGSLEYLYIYYMKNLRSIWEGSVQKNSLFPLKSLTLRTCPQLTTIFTQGLLDNLCNLEELRVEDCPSIKSIVSCEISAEPNTSYFLPNLKKISLHYMPGLVSISSGLYIAPKLEWLSFYNCPDLKNPLIDEISSQDLKKIKGERSWWEALEWSNNCPSYLEEIFVPIDIRDC
ncbi:uncharacterized protein LOC126716054 isoform X3 [Quercus robur]|uniref:uncharacterized protein LOC126716054 isoform X3 n=1 Tax=Quercus robur TaxID=38942 RepID=UPI00216210F5|nr:uncharacterized protein LOC126716054 isoform X3 [Quercus robur]